MKDKINLDNIDKTNKYYKQEGRVGAYQIDLPLLTTVSPMQKHIPHMWGAGAFMFGKDNYFEGYYEEDRLRQVAEDVLNLSSSDIPEDWQIMIKEVSDKMTRLSKDLVNFDLSQLSLDDLRTRYEELFELDQEMWAIMIFIDGFDIGVDQEKIIETKDKLGLLDEEVNILLTPNVPTFVTQWELALAQYKSGEITLERLKNEFFWYGMDYSTFREVTDEFIKKEMENDSSHGFDSPDRSQEEIINKYNLRENPLNFFKRLAFWRDERKKLNYIGLYGLMRILREVLNRQNINPELLNGLLTWQVNDLFSGKVTEDQLRSQISDGIFHSVDKDGKFRIVFGDEAVKCWHKVILAIEENYNDIGEITGMTASKGKAIGKVFVVNDPTQERLSKMKDGDILVTSMTRPEFILFMKKASAIVTNEGGISCHAAIVSREMKKPCIIGTKVATKVLKDGDMVEVDADNGVVRVVKKAE